MFLIGMKGLATGADSAHEWLRVQFFLAVAAKSKWDMVAMAVKASLQSVGELLSWLPVLVSRKRT